MRSEWVSPKFGEEGFNCPHCGTYSTQFWIYTRQLRNYQHHHVKEQNGIEFYFAGNLAYCACQYCRKVTVWVAEPTTRGEQPDASDWRQVYPGTSDAPPPSEDMPEDVEKDYLEARAIVGASPKGAAALLRLCIQRLMPHLGESGENLNNDIKSLVRKGLRTRVQQALDFVRVIGNESVHPGTIDLNDDRETALILFEQVNLIVEQTITADRKSEVAFNRLPRDKRDAIAKRDNNAVENGSE